MATCAYEKASPVSTQDVVVAAPAPRQTLGSDFRKLWFG
jgi:hypothetical protein